MVRAEVGRLRLCQPSRPPKHTGPQSLRHACATRLLHKGMFFVDIADFLGHRDTQSVNVYARLSTHMRREIAEMDLIDAL
jgi:integrase/recombinase XerD